MQSWAAHSLSLIHISMCIRDRNERGHKSEDYRNMEAALNEAIRVAQRQESMDQTLQVLLEFVGKNLEAGRDVYKRQVIELVVANLYK